MAKERKITIRGEQWRLRFSPYLRKSLGLCYFHRKLIVVKDSMTAAKTLDVLIHEGLHACFPDLDEQSVNQSATDIATMILTEPSLCRVLKQPTQ